MRKLVLLFCLALPLFAQPTSTARRIVHGASLPSTCSVGDIFFSTASSSAYVCTAANTWIVGTSSTGSVTGASSLTTQYAVPYVSAASGVLAQGTLFQCANGVMGIGGCTSSYPGIRRESGSLYVVLADNSAYAPINAIGGYFSGNLRIGGRIYSDLSTVTYSATPTFAAVSYNNFKLTLTGNVTSSTLSGAANGQLMVKEICQDSTGAHTYVHPASVVNGMMVGSGASSCSLQLYFWDGTYAQALTPGMVSGKPPVTVSGASCTITEITNGLITGATCP